MGGYSISDENINNMSVIAQFTDLHLDDGERNTQRTLEVLQFLQKIEKSLDLIIITGDISNDGRTKDYEIFLQLIEKSGISTPILCCPGNSDDIENFHTIMLPKTHSINQVHRLPNVTVLSLDSVIPRESPGILSDHTLAWLETVVSQETQPILLAMHHPPMPIGIAELDDIRLQNSTALAEIIAKYPQIIAILCGHTHTNTTTIFAGIPVHIVSGLSSSIAMNSVWNGAESLYARIHPIPLAFHFIENGIITTHFEYVPD